MVVNQMSRFRADSQVTYQNLAAESSESFRERLVPDVRLVSVDVDKPGVPADLAECVVVSIRVLLERK